MELVPHFFKFLTPKSHQTYYDSSKISMCYILKLIWNIRWISENITHVFEFAWLLSGIFSDKLDHEIIKIWNSIITKLPNTLVDKTQALLVTQRVLLHDFRLPPRGRRELRSSELLRSQ